MKNVVIGKALVTFMIATDLTEEEFLSKHHPENFIMHDMNIVLSDGSIHKYDIPLIEDFTIEEFEDNKEATERQLNDL